MTQNNDNISSCPQNKYEVPAPLSEKPVKQLEKAQWHTDEKMLCENSCFYCIYYQMKSTIIPYCTKIDFDTRPSAICKYFKEKK